MKIVGNKRLAYNETSAKRQPRTNACPAFQNAAVSSEPTPQAKEPNRFAGENNAATAGNLKPASGALTRRHPRCAEFARQRCR